MIIDQSVFENQKTVCIFIKNIPSNIKYKTKRLIIVIFVALTFLLSDLEPVEAMGLPMSPVPVVRVQPSFEDSYKKPKIAKLVPRKLDRITYKDFSKSKQELLLVMYMTDPRLASNQQILKLVKELRGGNWGVVGTTAFIAVIILIFSMREGFILNNLNLGWGLDKPNPFQPAQPPTSDIRYPPIYDVLSPRRTCYADRPGGSQIMHIDKMNAQSSRKQLTQVSTDVAPTKTQVSGFVKDGTLDLNRAFDEVNRRASAIGCENFDCSFDRFKELSTECGIISEGSVREAITVLYGEMKGYYKNARRVDYGPGVLAIDFAVDGIGKFDNITHVETKNAVGSVIEITDGGTGNIWQQGKKIGKKSVWQKNFWSNTTLTSKVPNLKPDAYLPKSVNNTLTVVDAYDVPNFEKAQINSAINFGAKNDTNLIILNNKTNI